MIRGRDSLFAPRAMGEFVIRLADAFGLENPHTVGPERTAGRRTCSRVRRRPAAAASERRTRGNEGSA
jgi:hypothetical protein